MNYDPLPNHLRPVPDSGSSAASALLDPVIEEIPGLTPPLHRGHSRGFTTDVVVELGYATGEQVQKAIEAARISGGTPESLLVSEGTISGDQLSRAIAERYGLDHVDLSIYQVDLGASGLFPVAMAKRYKAVPVGFISQQALLVAATDPANVLAVDDIQIATGLDCRIAVAAEEDVEALLSRLGTLQSATAEAIIEDEVGEDNIDEEAGGA
ncbi:MAG: hypothetical protein H0X42_05970, partial [Solirubrobacterales bacterium]|nr:hypothetical protein [Solirubrobacterales bacterium]